MLMGTSWFDVENSIPANAKVYGEAIVELAPPPNKKFGQGCPTIGIGDVVYVNGYGFGKIKDLMPVSNKCVGF